MNILIVSPSYPDKYQSTYPFVKQIVDQFALLGHQCCVVAPYNISHNRKIYSYKDGYGIGDGNYVEVLRPNYLSLSLFKFAGFYPTIYFRRKAQRKALKHLPFKPDIIYCHFWSSCHDVCHFAMEKQIPLFVATGESQIPQEESNGKYKFFNNYVSGVICVSTKNKEESIRLGLTSEEKCIVIPNAINDKLFHLMDKRQCRENLGIPQDVFICIFVGWFNERKGVRRVAKAINTIDGQPVYSMFIGGEDELDCNNILLKGRVMHDNMPLYLNAADVFVLPTLNEGCCNSVIEAMACGLPIISSDLQFNRDVLNETNSILIDPHSISQIAGAIVMLRDNITLRHKLSMGALETAKGLTISKRANKILDFIENHI